MAEPTITNTNDFPPDHEISLPALRLFLYSEKNGETIDMRIAEHVKNCEVCKSYAAILSQTDPVLTGNDKHQIEKLIRSV